MRLYNINHHVVASSNSTSVTERARKLRAQYALQAQSLRTRIELRINRIPTSLRKANMGELHAKYKEMLEARPHTVSEERKPVETENADAESRKRGRDTREIMSTAMPPPRGVKRNRYITHQRLYSVYTYQGQRRHGVCRQGECFRTCARYPEPQEA